MLEVETRQRGKCCRNRELVSCGYGVLASDVGCVADVHQGSICIRLRAYSTFDLVLSRLGWHYVDRNRSQLISAPASRKQQLINV